MQHSPSNATPPAQPSALNRWASLIGVVGCFLLFFVILCLAYLPNRPGRVDIDIVKERQEKLAAMRAHEKKELLTYAWIDQKAGSVQIPVELAMELTVRDLSAAQQAASNPSASYSK